MLIKTSLLSRRSRVDPIAYANAQVIIMRLTSPSSLLSRVDPSWAERIRAPGFHFHNVSAEFKDIRGETGNPHEARAKDPR